MTTQFPPPPVFGMPPNGDTSNRNGIISLVDIFDDFLFSSERSGSQNNAAGNLQRSSFEKDDFDEDDYDDDDDLSGDDSEDGKRRKRPRISQRSMTEDQKVERR